MLTVITTLVALAAVPAPAIAGVKRAWPLRSVRLPVVSAPLSALHPVVAVVDSGVDLAHADLRGALWTNPGEVLNGLDDDGDGYVDDIHGVDIVDPSRAPQDDVGHGTAVAGIIAAQGRGKGRVGIAPGARIMAVKVLDEHKQGTSAGLAAGVLYAVAHGANVINISATTPTAAADLHSAVRAAQDHGAIVVAAAGNDGEDMRDLPMFPAAFGGAGLIAVGATDSSGELIPESAYGSGVELAAPGLRVPALAIGGRVHSFSGTSAAAPHVSAAAALLLGVTGPSGSGVVLDALRRGARRTVALRGEVRYGALDVRSALLRVNRALRAAS